MPEILDAFQMCQSNCPSQTNRNWPAAKGSHVVVSCCLLCRARTKSNHNMCIVPWWQMNLQLILRCPVGHETRFLLVSMQRATDPKELFYWPYTKWQLCRRMCENVCVCVYSFIVLATGCGLCCQSLDSSCHYFSCLLIKANTTLTHTCIHTHMLSFIALLWCALVCPTPALKHQH